MSQCLRFLLAGAVLTMVVAGCSSSVPPPAPLPRPVAANNEPMPSPQEMERKEIAGIENNPKLDASDKKSYILQIKKQFAFLSASQPAAKSVGKSSEANKKTIEAKKAASHT